MKKEIKNNSFVFYASALETIEELEVAYPEIANSLMRAMIEYGIYGEFDNSNPLINAMMVQFTNGVDNAKSRYERAKENGKKGGRPKIQLNQAEVQQMKEELGTWKKVSAELGIDEDTLRKARKEWEKEKTEKPKNLNVNVNVNDNVDVNDNTFTFSTSSTTNTGATFEPKEEDIEKFLFSFENSLSERQQTLYNDLRGQLTFAYNVDVDEIILEYKNENPSTIIEKLIEIRNGEREKREKGKHEPHTTPKPQNEFIF